MTTSYNAFFYSMRYKSFKKTLMCKFSFCYFLRRDRIFSHIFILFLLCHKDVLTWFNISNMVNYGLYFKELVMYKTLQILVHKTSIPLGFWFKYISSSLKFYEFFCLVWDFEGYVWFVLIRMFILSGIAHPFIPSENKGTFHKAVGSLAISSSLWLTILGTSFP